MTQVLAKPGYGIDVRSTGPDVPVLEESVQQSPVVQNAIGDRVRLWSNESIEPFSGGFQYGTYFL